MTSSSLLDSIVNHDPQDACALSPFEPGLRFQDFGNLRRTHVIAVLIPMSGRGGMFGPSCITATQLAISEINDQGGIANRALEAIFLDCEIAAVRELVTNLGNLVEQEAIAGIINMGSSEMRQCVNKIVAGRIPHIFTSAYDGNEYSSNVFTIGTTSEEQFAPAVRRLTSKLRVMRWAMVGKNNVWPHPSSVFARQCIADCGGTIVFNRYAPDGIDDPFTLLEQVVRAKPDIVFFSLIGQHAVDFNRAFGEMGLDRKIFRLSELADENTLMACGAENTKNLFVASVYVTTLDADIHLSFKERYHVMHGIDAPAITVHSQSLYEGIHFFRALVRQRRTGVRGPIMYPTARGGVFHSNWHKEDPVYLAEADGLRFQILEELVC